VDATDIFGPLASFMGVLMSLAPLFQVRRILERGQADDVSRAFLIIPNTLGVVTNSATLFLVHRYQQRTVSSAR
jgi:hypothetical protein